MAVAGLRGLALYAGAVAGSRIVSAVIIAVLAAIEQPDSPVRAGDELLVWLPRVVQALATLMPMAFLTGALRGVDGVLVALIYGGCVLLGWAVRKATAPAIGLLVRRAFAPRQQPAMDGDEESEARIQGWNEAWARSLAHLEREQRAGPPAG